MSKEEKQFFIFSFCPCSLCCEPIRVVRSVITENSSYSGIYYTILEYYNDKPHTHLAHHYKTVYTRTDVTVSLYRNDELLFNVFSSSSLSAPSNVFLETFLIESDYQGAIPIPTEMHFQPYSGQKTNFKSDLSSFFRRHNLCFSEEDKAKLF